MDDYKNSEQADVLAIFIEGFVTIVLMIPPICLAFKYRTNENGLVWIIVSLFITLLIMAGMVLTAIIFYKERKNEKQLRLHENDETVLDTSTFD